MKKYYLLLISIIVLYSSCVIEDPEPIPVASFSFSGDGNFAPCSVIFSNQSQNATTIFWDFGDGESSTEKNPSHIYAEGGNYTVKLTAKNLDGVSNESSKEVVILNKPTKLKMTKIILTSFPVTEPDGGGWDNNNGPDLMFKISDDDGANYYESGIISDATISSLPVSFTNGLPLTFNNLDYKFTITLYDYDDLNANDWMGGYFFTPSNSIPTNGSYPETISFSSETSEVAFTINVEWLE